LDRGRRLRRGAGAGGGRRCRVAGGGPAASPGRELSASIAAVVLAARRRRPGPAGVFFGFLGLWRRVLGGIFLRPCGAVAFLAGVFQRTSSAPQPIARSGRGRLRAGLTRGGVRLQGRVGVLGQLLRGPHRARYGEGPCSFSRRRSRRAASVSGGTGLLRDAVIGGSFRCGRPSKGPSG